MAKELPKISIITPSYNQCNFIEETIQSVLSQNYPYLEYIIIDGGSTDGTINILNKYTKKIIWSSKKDNGQTDAINKGLKKSTGEIVGYLNSDDLYLPGTLFKIAEYFTKYDVKWLTGSCQVIDESGKEVRSQITAWKNFWLQNDYFKKNQFVLLLILNFISQPSTFWIRKTMRKIGMFDESLSFAMDYEYWLRLMKNYRLGILKEPLASFRIHSKSKSVMYSTRQFNEGYNIAKKYSNSYLIKFLHRVHDLLTRIIYRILSS